MILVIRTQYMENYGSHDWDGKDVCPQRWKYKGGKEYIVTGVNPNQDLEAVVDCAFSSESNDYYREYIIEWTLESDDYMSWYEKSQLEYDGVINYPESRVSWSELEQSILS